MANLAHTSKPRTYFRESAITVVVVFATCWLADQIGSLPLSFFLLWAPILYKFVWAAPVHRGATTLFLLGMVLEPPDERAGNGYWTPPFLTANVAFFGSLKAWLGIPGVSLNVFTLLTSLLLWKAYQDARKKRVLPPKEAVKLIQLYLGGLAVWMAWGLARGGAGQPAFWQILQAVAVGLLALLYLYALRNAEDVRRLGTALIVVALTKGLLVIWVYEVVCRPLNIKPFYATTHSDSVTFGLAFTIVCTRLLSERTKQTLWQAALLVPFLIVVVILNNRRLAFVGMGASLLIAYFMLEKGKLKRQVTRGAIFVAPVLALYVAVGANSSNPFFAPAKAISSVSTSSDASSITREIENYNLIQTAKRVLVFGSGFGHEYIEFVKADDISAGHPLYLYIPHNSVLWLLGVGGALGFWLLWLPYPGLAFFAAAAYRVSHDPLSRTIALSCSGAAFILMSQAWGDMGVNSFTCALLHGACFGAAGRMSALARPKPAGKHGSPPETLHEPDLKGAVP